MMETRLIASSMRALAGLVAFAGVLALTGCGGGNGAPNNPYEPSPPALTAVTVFPTSSTAYPGSPLKLTVSGGLAPYRMFSANTTVLPIPTSVMSGDSVLVVPNSVDTDTSISVTAQDSAGQTAPAVVTVKPAPLIANLITITGNTNCSSSGATLCSGQDGTAVVTLTGPGGGALAGRQVRYDVVQGDYALRSTNPATPLVSTLTVVSDQNGNATVTLAVPVAATTQIAILRATDVTSGNQVTGNFTIAAYANGNSVLSVVPLGKTTITGALQNQCSAGVRVAYYIFGGTPPYRVAAVYPDVITLVGVPVPVSGGGFTGAASCAREGSVQRAAARTAPASMLRTATPRGVRRSITSATRIRFAAWTQPRAF
jgi:hypothetical protein